MQTGPLVSSGVLVVRRRAIGGYGELEALFIRRGRKDFFELPKGRVEPGESLQRAALRELREEAGLDLTRAVEDVDMLFVHTSNYFFRGTDKKVHFFTVMLPREAPEIGLRERGTREHKWIRLADVLSEKYIVQCGNDYVVSQAIKLLRNQEAATELAMPVRNTTTGAFSREGPLASSRTAQASSSGINTAAVCACTAVLGSQAAVARTFEVGDVETTQTGRIWYRDPDTLELWWWDAATGDAGWDELAVGGAQSYWTGRKMYRDPNTFKAWWWDPVNQVAWWAEDDMA